MAQSLLSQLFGFFTVCLPAAFLGVGDRCRLAY